MFKNRSVKLTFVKDPAPGTDGVTRTMPPEHIERIARETVFDLTLLSVAAAGTLMTLKTALNIAEHHLTK